jgi:hypothetical protein
MLARGAYEVDAAAVADAILRHRRRRLEARRLGAVLIARELTVEGDPAAGQPDSVSRGRPA